jgi:CheY-like chemotaxis protein
VIHIFLHLALHRSGTRDIILAALLSDGLTRALPAGGKAREASAATAPVDSASLVEPTILRCPEREMAAALLVAVPPSQRAQTMTEQPTIIIVDDDPGIREALGSLVRSVGVQAKALASVPEFLNEGCPDGPTCLVLDVRLPGRSGLDFQRELAAANIHVPIIFITGYGDIPMSVQAIKGGAMSS